MPSAGSFRRKLFCAATIRHAVRQPVSSSKRPSAVSISPCPKRHASQQADQSSDQKNARIATTTALPYHAPIGPFPNPKRAGLHLDPPGPLHPSGKGLNRRIGERASEKHVSYASTPHMQCAAVLTRGPVKAAGNSAFKTIWMRHASHALFLILSRLL